MYLKSFGRLNVQLLGQEFIACKVTKKMAKTNVAIRR